MNDLMNAKDDLNMQQKERVTLNFRGIRLTQSIFNISVKCSQKVILISFILIQIQPCGSQRSLNCSFRLNRLSSPPRPASWYTPWIIQVTCMYHSVVADVLSEF